MYTVFLGSILFCLTSCQLSGENICENKGSGEDRRCCLNFYEYDGRCLACRNGTFGINCSGECPPGFYGYLCLSRCNCSSRQICLADYGCRAVETEPSIKNSTSNGTTHDLESAGKHYFLIVIGSSALGLLCIASITICITKSCVTNNRKDKCQARNTPSDINDVDRLNCTLSEENNQSILENAPGEYDHLELRLRNVNCESLDSVVDQANGEASNAYDIGTQKPCDLHRDQEMRDQSQLIMKYGNFENYSNGNRDSDSVKIHAGFTHVRRLSDDGNFYRQSKREIQQAEVNNEILYGNALECEEGKNKAGISPTSETTKYDLQEAEASNEILYFNALECEKVKNKAGVLPSSETTKYDLQKEKVNVSCKDIKLKSRRQDVYSLCRCVDDDHLTHGESPHFNFD